MKRECLAIVVAAVLCAVGCGPKEETASSASGTVKEETTTAPDPGDKKATAKLEPKSGSQLTGTATFVQKGKMVTLVVEVENAEPGVHGVHLHERGDCSSPDAKSAGDHWNPTNEAHGKIGETDKAHSGDMGNLEVGSDGKGRLEFSTDRWTIGGADKTNVVGKSIVVHAEADDLKTQPSGDSGDRVGCGVITEG